MAGDTKRRNRLILVCGNCHKKKIKCDRKLPCSSCVKLSIGQTCKYGSPLSLNFISNQNNEKMIDKLNSQMLSTDEQNLVATNQFLIEQVDYLKEKISVLEHRMKSYLKEDYEYKPLSNMSHAEISEDSLKSMSSGEIFDCILSFNVDFMDLKFYPSCSPKYLYNFYNTLQADFVKDDEIILFPHQPISQITLPRGDPTSKLMINYMSSNHSDSDDFYSIYFKEKELTRQSVELLDKKSIEYYGNKYIKRLPNLHDQAEVSEVKQSVSHFGQDVGITFTHLDLSLMSLAQQIISILPPVKFIKLLLEYHFAFINHSYPFLNKVSFTQQVEEILGICLDDEAKYLHIGSLNIKSKEDLAIFVILLLVLRMSYLCIIDATCCKNSNGIDSEERNYLLANPVPLDSISVAQKCINQLEFNYETKFSCLQALLFFYIYHSIAPEEGYLSVNFEFNQAFAKIVQQANILFLNREASHKVYWDYNRENPSEFYFKRKFWYALVLMDTENAIVMGTPTLTTALDHDVKFPTYTSYNNSTVSAEELNSTEALGLCSELFISSRNILARVFCLSSKLDMSKLLNEVLDYELLLKSILGELNDYLIPCTGESNLAKLMKVRVYLYSKVFLMYLFYSFFIYFEKKKDTKSSFFFLKKFYATSMYELAGITSGFIESCQIMFGPSSGMILKPIVLIVNRFQMISYITKIRIKCMILFKNPNGPILDILNSITDYLVFFGKETIRFVYKANKQNMYAWWFSKGYRFGQNIISSENYYTLNIEDSKAACLNFSIEDFNSLNHLLALCKKKFIYFKEYYLKQLQVSDSNTFPVDHERGLMEQVQIDKMWQFLQNLKTDNDQKEFTKNIYGNQCESFVSNDVSSSVSSTSNELWKIDFDVLRAFADDDIFFSN